MNLKMRGKCAAISLECTEKCATRKAKICVRATWKMRGIWRKMRASGNTEWTEIHSCSCYNMEIMVINAFENSL